MFILGENSSSRVLWDLISQQQLFNKAERAKSSLCSFQFLRDFHIVQSGWFSCWKSILNLTMEKRRRIMTKALRHRLGEFSPENINNN